MVEKGKHTSSRSRQELEEKKGIRFHEDTGTVQSVLGGETKTQSSDERGVS